MPGEARETLETLRRTVLTVVPDAVESVSYGVPTFKYRGRPLAYLGAAKSHCAVYGFDITACKDELARYDTAKGTIRFPHGEPLPAALFEKLLRARVAEIDRT